MKRPRNITTGEGIAQAHQAPASDVLELDLSEKENQEYHARKFARALLQRLYPGLTIDKTPVSVHKRDSFDYKKYDDMEKDPLAFGEVHVIGTGEALSSEALQHSIVTVSPQEVDMGSPLYSVLQKIGAQMLDYCPASLRTLHTIIEHPELYVSRLFTPPIQTKGILIPGVVFRNPVGIWCVPLITVKNGNEIRVDSVTLRDVAHAKLALYVCN